MIVKSIRKVCVSVCIIIILYRTRSAGRATGAHAPDAAVTCVCVCASVRVCARSSRRCVIGGRACTDGHTCPARR